MFEVNGLEKSFGSLVVTHAVSLALPPGRRHGLIGPNGAGKTTLFNLLTGELKPDAGRVLLNGRDITHTAPHVRVRAGIARSFQRNNLFAEMTVRENLTVACALQQGITPIAWRSLHRFRELKQQIENRVESLGLSTHIDQRAGQLSYGTQRQLEIGLALERQPKVLLLDEPTSGMSPEETVLMKQLIRDLPETLTVLIIEHDMEVIFDLTERITVLDYGQILFEGTPYEVRHCDDVQRRYLGEPN